MQYRVLKEFVGPLGGFYDVNSVYVPTSEKWSLYVKSLIDNGFIEEIKDEPWKPKEGDEYEYLTDTGKPSATYWNNTGVDKSRYALGNCFKRQIGRQVSDATLHASEWLKAFKVLRDDTKGFKPDWKDKEQPKWRVYFDIYCGDGGRLGELQVEDERFYHDSIIHFATKENARESIKNHCSEWLTFLGVE